MNMSWSLQIQNGDLAFGSNGLNVAKGPQKLTQDLKCALLEPQGTDPLHPTFGSIIDGGYDTESGEYIEGAIGGYNDSAASTFIAAEVQRVCTAHQAAQINRNQEDVNTYGRSTLTADEALIHVSGVQVDQVTDQALVTATIQTGAGSLPLVVPFSAS